MKYPRCEIVALRDEAPELLSEEDRDVIFSAFSSTRRNRFRGFIAELIAAHRYVNNRRTASNAN